MWLLSCRSTEMTSGDRKDRFDLVYHNLSVCNSHHHQRAARQPHPSQSDKLPLSQMAHDSGILVQDRSTDSHEAMDLQARKRRG